MKFTKSILMAGSLVTFAAVPVTLANGGKGAEVTPAVEEGGEAPVEDVVVEDEVIVIDDEVSEEVVVEDGEGSAEPEIVICDRGKDVDIEVVDEGEVVELVDPAICEMTGGPEVQRGEDKGLENPDVIFQNTAVDLPGTPVTKAEAGFGSDERAAAIQAKSAAMSPVKKDKKGPVALIKKGRVFLR